MYLFSIWICLATVKRKAWKVPVAKEGGVRRNNILSIDKENDLLHSAENNIISVVIENFRW